MELRAAITAPGAESITSQTFAMNPHQDVFLAGHLAFDQCQVVQPIGMGKVQIEIKITLGGGHLNHFNPLH